MPGISQPGWYRRLRIPWPWKLRGPVRQRRLAESRNNGKNVPMGCFLVRIPNTGQHHLKNASPRLSLPREKITPLHRFTQQLHAAKANPWAAFIASYDLGVGAGGSGRRFGPASPVRRRHLWRRHLRRPGREHDSGGSRAWHVICRPGEGIAGRMCRDGSRAQPDAAAEEGALAQRTAGSPGTAPHGLLAAGPGQAGQPGPPGRGRRRVSADVNGCR